MSKDRYDCMKYPDLRQLYSERCGYLGVQNPEIPTTKKGLVTMLRMADMLGVPQEEKTNPTESIRNAVVGILEKGIAESKRTGKRLPVIVS